MIFPRSFYSIDFTIVAERLLPPFMRQSKQLAWLKSLLTPMQEIRDNLIDVYYYDGGVCLLDGSDNFGLNERLKYNSQTILLEFILNKEFAVVSAPFIYIENFVGGLDTIYLTDVSTGDVPAYVGDSPNQVDTLFIANEDEYLPAYDFTVWVPLALYNTLGATNPERSARVQTEVNKYKLIGVTNNIATY
jgi:hypothetical protein